MVAVSTKGLDLTWHSGSKRWRKRRTSPTNGQKKDFYFAFPNSMEGYQAALAAWKAKLAELEAAENAANGDIRRGRARVKEMKAKAKYFDLVGKPAQAREEREAAQQIEAEIEAGGYEDMGFDPPMSEAGQWVWADRLATVAKVHDPQDGQTLSSVIADFVAFKQAQAKAGTRSASRFDNIRRYCLMAVEILGDIPLQQISERSMTAMYSALLGRTNMGQDYSRDVFQVFQQLVRWAWQNRYIDDLPRNIKSDEWDFSCKAKSKKKKVKVENKQIKDVLAKADERTQLWVLLALNCGWTQIDIAALEASEVDWQEGTITKQRVKTEGDPNVPIVTYRLWPRTLELLRKLGKRQGLVLRTIRNKPLKTERLDADGKVRKSDPIGLSFRRFLKDQKMESIPFKSFRKTGSTVLNRSKEYRGLRFMYLGHAPLTMAEKAYDVHDPEFQPLFDEVILHLGRELGLVEA